MNDETQIAHYKAQTLRLSERLDEVRQQILEWIELNSSGRPPVAAIARLEALHTERTRLFADLLAVEQHFMEILAASLRP